MASSALAELKVPAQDEFIPVVKRVASSLGSQMGFSLEELDELCIAVTQACDIAIEASQESWGAGASLKLHFASTDRGIAVEVQALGPRSPQALPPAAVRREEEDAVRQLSQDMIRCFVDDFRSMVDMNGRIRYRMVKYLLT